MRASASASDVAESIGSTQYEFGPLTAPHQGVPRASQVLGSPGDEDTNMFLVSSEEEKSPKLSGFRDDGIYAHQFGSL